MPNFHAVAIRAAQRNGINPQLFLRQIQQESGFNPNARSSSGAIGIAQIVPHWHPGVDAHDPVASLNYAAHLMGTLYRKYGDYQQALSVYNSGNPEAYKDPNFAKGQTFNYVKGIMGGPDVAPVSRPVRTAPLGQLGVPAAASGGASGLLRQSLSQTDAMLGMAPSPLLALAAPRPMPVAPLSAPLTPAVPTANPGQWARLSKTADRAGVGIHPQVVDFVSQVARMYGKPLTIGTGTNHNEYVLGTHRESDHWTGWAADIPASGAALTRLGQDALIAAGANPSWARKQKGGLYNIGGKQIIYNSMEGGNHFNHLHVGIRTR